MGRIAQIEPDVKGHVRSVLVKCADSDKLLRRPIAKLVLLIEAEVVRFPDEGAKMKDADC